MAMLIFMQFHHGEWSAENLFIFPENVTHPFRIKKLLPAVPSSGESAKFNTRAFLAKMKNVALF